MWFWGGWHLNCLFWSFASNFNEDLSFQYQIVFATRHYDKSQTVNADITYLRLRPVAKQWRHTRIRLNSEPNKASDESRRREFARLTNEMAWQLKDWKARFKEEEKDVEERSWKFRKEFRNFRAWICEKPTYVSSTMNVLFIVLVVDNTIIWNWLANIKLSWKMPTVLFVWLPCCRTM